jgi:hypothetical protein
LIRRLNRVLSVSALLGEEVTSDERSQYKDAHATTWNAIKKVCSLKSLKSSCIFFC